MSDVARKLEKIRTKIRELHREEEALVREAFPVDSEVTVLKNSVKGWPARVVDHCRYTSDLYVENTRSHSRQRIPVTWVKEAQ